MKILARFAILSLLALSAPSFAGGEVITVCDPSTPHTCE